MPMPLRQSASSLQPGLEPGQSGPPPCRRQDNPRVVSDRRYPPFAPAQSGAVYGYVSDPANDVNWRTGVTESGLTTDPPLALGSEGFVKVGNQVGRWVVTAIEPGVSVEGVLHQLNIPSIKAHLIFINGVKRSLGSRLSGGERVGIFPPVAGG